MGSNGQALCFPSPFRGEGGAQRRMRGEAVQRALSEKPHPSLDLCYGPSVLATLALSPEGRGDDRGAFGVD